MNAERIVEWINEYVEHHAGVVIGLSGGLDSSVVAALCVKALGKDRVLGVIMPIESSPDDFTHADIVVEQLGISCIAQTLEEPFQAMKDIVSGDRLIYANIKARLRMTYLYAIAGEQGYLVAGTGNRSELMTGYFTKYGDGGVDFEPIGHLYKTEVRELAKELGVPQNIIDKPPSAGLWDGQTDEDELGVTYEQLDKCLKWSLEWKGEDPDPMIENKVSDLMTESRHKREMPPALERED